MRRQLIAIALPAIALLVVSCATSVEPQMGPAEPAPLTDLPSGSRKVIVRFAVIGDFGAASDEQYRLAERMCRWRQGHPFKLVLTTGDNIYPGGEQGNFDAALFTPYDCLFDSGVRFRATLGNHDVVTEDGRPELDEDAFGLKGRNYIVRRARPPQVVRFVMWDSNRANARWLRRRVGKDDWTIVAFHHPVFSPGPHGPTPGFAPKLPRMFRRAGVDLVVNGHDHLYARMPPHGRVRYVVTGGGGAGLYGCELSDAAEVCTARHHFLYVVVHPDRIVVRAVPIRGRPFDRFATEGRV